MTHDAAIDAPIDSPKPKSRWKRVLGWAKRIVLTCVVVFLLGELGVWWVSRGLLFDSVDDVPAAPVGVVLGCSPRVQDGRPNLFFEYRMDTAAALWDSGKVNALILSGDNSERYYNEPVAMRDALIKRGVPRDHLTLDFAGFRTLDSVLRADKVFGQSRVVIVSQRFHNQRAVAIARHFGMDATAVNARAVRGGLKTLLRERLARVKLLLDLYVLDTQPKFLGDPVDVPLN